MLSRAAHHLWEVIKFALITAVIVIPIRTYIAQPFIVSGASMYPTFDDNEYLIIDELSYHFRAPARGEVIVFKYPKDPSKYFIKRIVGLPGETLLVRTDGIFLRHPDGRLEQINEPYIQGESYTTTEVALGPHDYFVMGDNRGASLDSRSWGALPEALITGRAFIRLFPPNRIGLLPGQTATN